MYNTSFGEHSPLALFRNWPGALALFISLSLLSVTNRALAESYVPYGYKFEPLPKYDELRKPAKGRGTYLKDPNVWVYTREFAERFGMPERWIDESLKGAQAVAYLVEASNTQSCGFFGEKENCRPRLYCIFDLYITDEESAKLPWESHKSADWIGKDSSRVFLNSQHEEDHWHWTDEVRGIRYVRRGPTGLRSVVFVEGPPSKKHDWVYSGQGPMYMRSYRRDFFKGLDLLELTGCMVTRADKPVRIYFLDPQPSMNEPQYRLPNGEVNRLKLDAAKKLRHEKWNAGNPPPQGETARCIYGEGCRPRQSGAPGAQSGSGGVAALAGPENRTATQRAAV